MPHRVVKDLQKILYAIVIIICLSCGVERIPYHDSIRSGQKHYEELIGTDNDNKFRDENRMDKETFIRLLHFLQDKGEFAII